MILRTSLTIALAVGLYSPVFGQASRPRPPVIDVHLHAPLRAGPIEDFTPRLEAVLAEMERLNVRRVVLNGLPDVLFAWRREIGADRVITSLLFPCERGVAVNWGRPCFDDGADWPEIGQLREHIEAGRVQALGEITTQYLGLGPSDPALEPYFALAEEYDLPVFIHMGPGPRFSAYDENEFLVKAPNYRAAAGNPLLLEEVLLRHPSVRVAVMHSGWPLADEMVFMLYQHPQVYAEVGILQHTPYFPRPAYYSFLRRLVEAGFSDRILFGSDADLSDGVDAILDADFLTGQQKADILCNNAARFLRLGEDVCR